MKITRHTLLAGLFMGTLGMGILSAAALTPEQEEELVRLYEEERVALELYEKFEAKWQLRPFANIQRSEQRHREMMASLLKKHEIEVPAARPKGEFEGDLKAIYETLSAQGDKSLKDALMAAALVEETDIHDLKEARDAIDSPAVKRVCDQLIAASKNHLRAFVKNYQSRFGEYTPQVLSADEVKTILDAPHGHGKGKRQGQGADCEEGCDEGGRGQGQGRGRGKGGGQGRGQGKGRGPNR